ncbi:VP2 transmembrane domain protein [Sulfolobus ellipsoid virus 1]|uniref:VP2 transmembrane domain protein n=1 Tax=Sulfolobus ellipsoid virus 1 TaxID=2056194 RepID=A0A2H4RBR1_9VIRU|nr:VP2 transmembrane domain protein [Sulfolobus ellipsoid virus 1]ATY46507.1 VP2 transmembrane domain protein [Sulfolobus ellipsoid virus 1]
MPTICSNVPTYSLYDVANSIGVNIPSDAKNVTCLSCELLALLTCTSQNLNNLLMPTFTPITENNVFTVLPQNNALLFNAIKKYYRTLGKFFKNDAFFYAILYDLYNLRYYGITITNNVVSGLFNLLQNVLTQFANSLNNFFITLMNNYISANPANVMYYFFNNFYQLTGLVPNGAYLTSSTGSNFITPNPSFSPNQNGYPFTILFPTVILPNGNQMIIGVGIGFQAYGYLTNTSTSTNTYSPYIQYAVMIIPSIFAIKEPTANVIILNYPYTQPSSFNSFINSNYNANIQFHLPIISVSISSFSLSNLSNNQFYTPYQIVSLVNGNNTPNSQTATDSEILMLANNLDLIVTFMMFQPAFTNILTGQQLIPNVSQPNYTEIYWAYPSTNNKIYSVLTQTGLVVYGVTGLVDYFSSIASVTAMNTPSYTGVTQTNLSVLNCFTYNNVNYCLAFSSNPIIATDNLNVQVPSYIYVIPTDSINYNLATSYYTIYNNSSSTITYQIENTAVYATPSTFFFGSLVPNNVDITDIVHAWFDNFYQNVLILFYAPNYFVQTLSQIPPKNSVTTISIAFPNNNPQLISELSFSALSFILQSYLQGLISFQYVVLPTFQFFPSIKINNQLYSNVYLQLDANSVTITPSGVSSPAGILWNGSSFVIIEPNTTIASTSSLNMIYSSDIWSTDNIEANNVPVNVFSTLSPPQPKQYGYILDITTSTTIQPYGGQFNGYIVDSSNEQLYQGTITINSPNNQSQLIYYYPVETFVTQSGSVIVDTSSIFPSTVTIQTINGLELLAILGVIAGGAGVAYYKKHKKEMKHE